MPRHNDSLYGAAVDLSGLLEEGLLSIPEQELSPQTIGAMFKSQLLDTGHLKADEFDERLKVGKRARVLRYYGQHDGRDYICDKPYWTTLYYGGEAIIRTINAKPQLVRNRSVYEISAGTGAAGIAAMMLGARDVTSTDADPLAVAAIIQNAELNNVDVTTGLADATAPIPEGTDVVLAGDAVKPNFLSRTQIQVVRATWNKFRRRGGTVIIGDSYLRESLPFLADVQSDLPAPARRYYDQKDCPEVDAVVLGPI